MPTHIQRITQVVVEGPHTVRVTFADGLTRSIDLTPILRGPVFGVLRNPAEFARVAIDPDFGALVWPSGADLDPGVLHAWPEEGERMAELAAGWE